MVAAWSPATTWSSSSVESIRNGVLMARMESTPTRSQARVATRPSSASPAWIELDRRLFVRRCLKDGLDGDRRVQVVHGLSEVVDQDPPVADSLVVGGEPQGDGRGVLGSAGSGSSEPHPARQMSAPALMTARLCRRFMCVLLRRMIHTHLGEGVLVTPSESG